ncbi:hypothetical protein L3Q82_003048 [Scortum barcoo]|uniref:Uncharacterized protein n=1 Tax=Scortum barcoo TaxID=214431 RepID=A0ACB8VT00_9TELE|nr:hypothetical protein L3Q82_003048 [Scortum barcoo]
MAPEDTGLAQRCPPDRGQEEAVCAEAEEGQTGGLLARLKANAGRPLIPSLFLSNVRSLDNKLDLLRLRLGASREMRNCAVLCHYGNLAERQHAGPSLPDRRPASLPCGPQPAVGESQRGRIMRLREKRLVHKLYFGEQPLLRGDRAHDCKVPATLSAP